MPDYMTLEIIVDHSQSPVLRWTQRDILNHFKERLTIAEFDIEKPIEHAVGYSHEHFGCVILNIRQEKRFKLISPYEVIPSAII